MYYLLIPRPAQRSPRLGPRTSPSSFSKSLTSSTLLAHTAPGRTSPPQPCYYTSWNFSPTPTGEWVLFVEEVVTTVLPRRALLLKPSLWVRSFSPPLTFGPPVTSLAKRHLKTFRELSKSKHNFSLLFLPEDLWH